jgi:hypothetical protein
MFSSNNPPVHSEAYTAGADSFGISHGAHGTKLLKTCQPLDIVNNLFQAQQWLDTNI